MQCFFSWVRQVQHILADAMQQSCPDIPFVTEYLLADRWYKGLDDQPTDESGRIVLYKNNCLALASFRFCGMSVSVNCLRNRLPTYQVMVGVVSHSGP